MCRSCTEPDSIRCLIILVSPNVILPSLSCDPSVFIVLLSCIAFEVVRWAHFFVAPANFLSYITSQSMYHFPDLTSPIYHLMQRKCFLCFDTLRRIGHTVYVVQMSFLFFDSLWNNNTLTFYEDTVWRVTEKFTLILSYTCFQRLN